LIHLIEDVAAGSQGSGEVPDSGCADSDDRDVSEQLPNDTQSDISEKGKVRSRNRDMREDFERDAKIKRSSGNAHNRPEDNRDQFGGSGIIPFNVANMVLLTVYLKIESTFIATMFPLNINFCIFCLITNLQQSYEEYLQRFRTHPNFIIPYHSCNPSFILQTPANAERQIS
jgi:hypothetical protein